MMNRVLAGCLKLMNRVLAGCLEHPRSRVLAFALRIGSYTAPIRSYTAPIRSYTGPIRFYTAPIRFYTSPARPGRAHAIVKLMVPVRATEAPRAGVASLTEDRMLR